MQFLLWQTRFDLWCEFHAANPEVFELFQKFTYQAFNSGRRRMGGQCIAERIRWYTAVEVNTRDYKINNNHVAYYCRLIEALDPRLEGFFCSRESSTFDASRQQILDFHMQRFSHAKG